MKIKYDLVQHGTGFVGSAFLQAIRKRQPDLRIAGMDIDGVAIARMKGYGIPTFPEDAVEECQALIHSFSIGTPSCKCQDEHQAVCYELTPLSSALCSFAVNVLSSADEFRVIVIRSTVVPTTTRNELIPVLEKYSKKTSGTDFGVVYNPEFLRQVTALEDATHPPLISYAASDNRTAAHFETFFSFFGVPFIRFDTFEQAEAHKCVNNTLNASVISFFNEWGLKLQAIGMPKEEIEHIFRASCQTAFVKKEQYYGAALKGPFGGTCLPKDTKAAIECSERIFGMRSPILESALEINRRVSQKSG